MFRPRIFAATLLAAFLFTGTVVAGTEVMEIDPLADKDLYHFKVEGPGEWAIDDKSDDLHTLIVCPKSSDDTGLLFIKRKFKHGFRFTMEVNGGSRHKGLEFYLVPPQGDRILVPFSKRWLAKKGWHEVMATLENGKIQVKVGEDEGDVVEVDDGVEYTFAIKLLKRSEAMFRKPMVKFLVISEEQVEPEEGFVRIFDGTSSDGWITLPADKPEVQGGFKVGDQRIEGKFAQGPQFYAQYVYKDAVFTDYVFKFKASADTRGLHLAAAQGQVPAIDDYFARDRDWNEVEWTVQDLKVELKINGSMVWQTKLEQPVGMAPQFFLHPGGQCTVRDIRVKGQNRQPGPTWAKYASDSGASAGGGQFGGRGNNQPGAGGAAAGSPAGGRQLFNGTDLTDWGGRPGGAWTVENGKMIGLTLDQSTAAELIYQKYVFTNYRLVFKVQRGTAGAKFIARAIPPADGKKDPILVEIKDEWLADQEWNDFEVVATGENLVIKVNGKQVHSGTIYKDRGFVGFFIAPNSAIGIKDVFLH